MKFIDLFNKNKDCADFIHRNKQFKLYSYLMKKNPGEFKIEWDSKTDYFRYYQWIETYYMHVDCSVFNWKELDNSNGKYKTMGDYERF